MPGVSPVNRARVGQHTRFAGRIHYSRLPLRGLEPRSGRVGQILGKAGDPATDNDQSRTLLGQRAPLVATCMRLRAGKEAVAARLREAQMRCCKK